MAEITDKVIDRLEALRKKGGGVLTPEAVLADAKAKASPLHAHFDWDDTVAAHRYRLIQAGQLIVRVKVTIEPRTQRDVQVDVQMYEQTGQEQGERVYRHIADIATNEEYYAELLDSAKKELQAFQRRYQSLKELRALFEQIEKLFAA